DHLQKLGKNVSAVLKEQMSVGRRGSDHDVAALFRLGSEVASEHGIHGGHVLGAPAEGQDSGVRLGGIGSIGKNDFIVNGGPADFLGLLQHLGADGQGYGYCEERSGKDRHPLRPGLFHKGSLRVWENGNIDSIRDFAGWVLSSSTRLRLLRNYGHS